MTVNDSEPKSPGLRQSWLWGIRLLCLAAASIAGYLLWVSLHERGLPVGCGAGGGCAEVLTSRWASILGIPVSAPALAVYLGILAATFSLRSDGSSPRQRIVWNGLLVVTGIVAGAALWFIGLQLFALEAICPWCMADHLFGLILAGLVWNVAPSQDAIEASKVKASIRWGRARIAGLALVGTLGFVTLNWITGTSSSAALRLPAGQNADTGPGPDRQVSVLHGNLQLKVSEEPLIGSIDARYLVLAMFDYCCPHCRRTHAYLVDGINRAADDFALVVLPVPLDSDCNPYIDETEPRFQNACQLTRLALAVWQVKPEVFADYDQWLFETRRPRDSAEARLKAEELIGGDALERALRDNNVDRRITRNVEAYESSGAARIPVILSPGIDAIVGRPESEEALWELLRSELAP